MTSLQIGDKRWFSIPLKPEIRAIRGEVFHLSQDGSLVTMACEIDCKVTLVIIRVENLFTTKSQTEEWFEKFNVVVDESTQAVPIIIRVENLFTTKSQAEEWFEKFKVVVD